ncbi:MAG: M28 family peptidase [Bacteroidia bacterium]
MRISLFAVVPAALFSAFLFSALQSDTQKDPVRMKYAETVTAADLKRHLDILASDDYQGRETGKKGQKMAAEYIRGCFENMGIPKLSTGGYYQDVPLEELIPGNGTVTAGTATFSFDKDFYYTSGIDDQELNAQELVFAGYGISAKNWNDYGKLSLRGKFVMILADEPVDASGKSHITGKTEKSDWTNQRRMKINAARERGAKALLIVVPDFEKRKADMHHAIETTTLILKGEKVEARMPVIYISPEMANAMAGNRKKTIQQVQSRINAKKKSASFVVKNEFSMTIKRERRQIVTENVLGFIEGSDLKNEFIVVTAHYDHIGMEGDVVFNGADDDGSGTVAVIELAEAFMKAKKEGNGPRRSILFMTVSGEEKGLLGSQWYSENPVFPMRQTICNLNIDMIGRVDPDHEKDTAAYVYVIGSDKLSSQLRAVSEATNSTYCGINLDYRYDAPDDPNFFYYRSDHYNFARKNVPVIFYFNGTHADYHKETDEVSKINFSLMERRARLVFYTAWEIANRDGRIVVDKK